MRANCRQKCMCEQLSSIGIFTNEMTADVGPELETVLASSILPDEWDVCRAATLCVAQR
jgi:hypothetical protein